MSKLRIAAVTLLAVSFPVVAGLPLTYAAPANHHTAMARDHIVVKITTSNGTTFGKVTPDWMSNGKMVMGKVCAKARCTYSIPHMTRITLTEKPTHRKNWRFRHWVLRGSSEGHMMMMTRRKITFEAMGKKATAKAVYAFK